MARLDNHHWLVEGRDTWGTIATAVGVTHNALLLANNEKPATVAPAAVGSIVHLPFLGA